MSSKELYDAIKARFDEARFISHMGMELTGVGEGRAQSRLKVEDIHKQQDGFIHAGVVAALADHTGGAAGWTIVKPHQTVLTTDFQIRYLHPARGDVITCRSRVIRPGGRIIVVESEVYDPGETLAAKLSMALAVVDTGKVRA